MGQNRGVGMTFTNRGSGGHRLSPFADFLKNLPLVNAGQGARARGGGGVGQAPEGRIFGGSSFPVLGAKPEAAHSNPALTIKRAIGGMKAIPE